MTYPDAVADVADLILQDAEAALVNAGQAAPARVYRSHGQPAWDLCSEDALVVYVATLQPAPGAQRCAVRWRAEFHVQIIRCVPGIDDNGRAPTADALDGSAADLLRDAWVLAAAMPSFAAAAVGCDDVVAGAARALGPSGGVAAWDLPLTVSITGQPVGS